MNNVFKSRQKRLRLLSEHMAFFALRVNWVDKSRTHGGKLKTLFYENSSNDHQTQNKKVNKRRYHKLRAHNTC